MSKVTDDSPLDPFLGDPADPAAALQDLDDADGIDAPLSPTEREDVLAEVWQASSRLPKRNTRFVLLVRDPLTRRVVRDQIAGELPGIPVVAVAELRQDVRIVEADGHGPPADAPAPPGQPAVRPGRRRLHVPKIPHSPPRRGV